ncbi:MAG: hypothetical protein MUE88_01285 [Flavobacteriales bacterium]|jgi:hypothetical protein|nr:hypothetical protein [Flavobacteriales bacterium]
MNTPATTYSDLKNKAKQLLLAGDLERYLRLLRTMHTAANGRRPALA